MQSGFSEEQQVLLHSYFGRFAVGFSSALRKYKGRLGQDWQRIDSHDHSAIIYLCSDGFHARLVPIHLGEWVKLNIGRSLKEVLETKFRDFTVRRFERVQFSVSVKEQPGHSSFDMWLTRTLGPQRLMLDTNSQKPFQLIAPQLKVQSKTIKGTRETRCAPFPWLYAYFVRELGFETPPGLDPDPFIAAHGIADHILDLSEVASDSAARLDQAVTLLRNAIQKLGGENEKILHQVVTRYPFILVDEYDYDDFWAEKTFEVTEVVQEGKEKRRLRPDFIYKLAHEEEFLIVEIESAAKSLLKRTGQTSFQLPRAETVAAGFQIYNYKRLMDRIGYQEIRRKLGVPDRWKFRFLLVVGSTEQANFDQRSWNNVKEVFDALGVTVRTWDYYIDRLTRRAEAGRFFRQG